MSSSRAHYCRYFTSSHTIKTFGSGKSTTILLELKAGCVYICVCVFGEVPRMRVVTTHDTEYDQHLYNSRTTVLPRFPVSRLVGHDDNGPIPIVRFTGTFLFFFKWGGCVCLMYTYMHACMHAYTYGKQNRSLGFAPVNDEETFSRLDRRLTYSVLTTTFEIFYIPSL